MEITNAAPRRPATPQNWRIEPQPLSSPEVKSMFVAVQPFDPGYSSFKWLQNTETNLEGYRIYYGPNSRAYTNSIRLGRVSSGTVNGLVPGARYYFALTAVNDTCLESDFSNELTQVITHNPDPIPPSTLPVEITDVSYTRPYRIPSLCNTPYFLTFTMHCKQNTKYQIEQKVGDGPWIPIEQFNNRQTTSDPEASMPTYISYQFSPEILPKVLFYRVRTVTE